MTRMKKFFLYFILFIALYLFVNLLTYVCMNDSYKDITNYEILFTSPQVEILECKATRTDGYIKGKITNDTGEHIPQKYIEIDLYNEKNVYLGTEYKEIKYFNIDETINFEINFRYNNVSKIKISFVDEAVKIETKAYNIFDVDDETLKIAIPIGVLLGIYAILP